MSSKKLLIALALACMAGNAAALEATFENASTTSLGNPHDIELSKNGAHLYVSDVDNNRLTVLDSLTLEKIGTIGESELNAPHDVDLGQDGRLYVADSGNNRIAIFERTSGKFKLTGKLTGNFRSPEGVVRLPDGSVVAPGAWTNNVLKFVDGQTVARATGYGGPHDIELDGEGNIWLADASNNRILKLSPDLKTLKEFSGPPYFFIGVRYLAFDGKGIMWAADKYTHRVLAIDPQTGKVLLVLGMRRAGKGANLFRTPEGVAVRGDTLWIADSGNNRVVRYRLNR